MIFKAILPRFGIQRTDSRPHAPTYCHHLDHDISSYHWLDSVRIAALAVLRRRTGLPMNLKCCFEAKTMEKVLSCTYLG